MKVLGLLPDVVAIGFRDAGYLKTSSPAWLSCEACTVRVHMTRQRLKHKPVSFKRTQTTCPAEGRKRLGILSKGKQDAKTLGSRLGAGVAKEIIWSQAAQPFG